MPPQTAPGVLMPIGGAEDKVRESVILARVTELAGGSAARIVVITTASAFGAEVKKVYSDVFGRLGAHAVETISPKTREAADDQNLVDLIDQATGVFMSGGNQLVLSTVVAGTQLGAAIHHAHERGAVVAGTSAGASVQSEHMIAFGRSGATPRMRSSQLSAGLGLVPDAIIDQHFTQRNRIGRLLSLVSGSPHLLGLGLDEDTAAEIRPDQILHVLGRGVATILDGRDMQTSYATARRSQPLLASGVILHALPAGAQFDLRARKLVATHTVDPSPHRYGGDGTD